MNYNFWQKLSKPLFVLAPMANVTDAAFRRIIAKYGKPDVMFTEFVSCEGLLSAGREALLVDLQYSESERPIVAQIFGAKPDHFYQCALLLQELGFDGIDINMGCPDANIKKQGACAELMRDPTRAQKIIRATKRGAGKLPVSVKTRIGYNKIEIGDWTRALLETQPAAITFHLRTRKEMSNVPAHWDVISEAVELAHAADNSANRTLILGNGDVASLAEAQIRVDRYGIDGVMIGRGIFGNPWLFKNAHQKSSPTLPPPSAEEGGTIGVHERLEILLEHTKLFEQLLGHAKNFALMKKHYKAYVNGWPGAKELRVKLMAGNNAAEVEKIIKAKKLVS